MTPYDYDEEDLAEDDVSVGSGSLFDSSIEEIDEEEAERRLEGDSTESVDDGLPEPEDDGPTVAEIEDAEIKRQIAEAESEPDDSYYIDPSDADPDDLLF